MKTLALILAALILPALCYVAWCWFVGRAIEEYFRKADEKGFATEETEPEWRQE